MEETADSRNIQVLSSELIHRIAAGEVVDRPASALKELIENSIDSGATEIRIQIVDGGLGRIEVEDNGCGFGKANLEVALQRHATSKIKNLEDLDQILSLGFRGEALSAIASVSKLSIDSRRSALNEGAYFLKVMGGVRSPIVPGLRKKGTKITVDDLFFNVPARKKFLSKSSSEARECYQVIEKLALSHPEISFEAFIVDDQGKIRDKLILVAATPEQRFGQITKIDVEPIHLKSKNEEDGVLSLEVLFFPPPVAVQTQKKIFLSVNGRSVSDKRLPFSLREAFSGLIEIGQYPVAHVICQVDPSKIDVNIHPQKKEIRWPSNFSLASRAYQLLRPFFEIPLKTINPNLVSPPNQSLSSGVGSIESPVFSPSPPVPNTQTHFTLSNSPEFPTFAGLDTSFSAALSSGITKIQDPFPWSLSETSTGSAPSSQDFQFSSLRVIGECGASWLLCESASGLVIIDQHAAHERVSFEKFMKEDGLWTSKPLLFPVELPIPYYFKDQVEEIVKQLESLGFEVSDENFEQKINILAVPNPLRSLKWEEMLRKIFHRLEEGRDLASLSVELKTQLSASLACHGSVRRGQRLASQEIVELLMQMDQVNWGGFCPHGRPVWFLLSHKDIENRFHR